MKKLAVTAVAVATLAALAPLAEASHIQATPIGVVRTFSLTNTSTAYIGVRLVAGRSYEASAWTTTGTNTDQVTCAVTWQDPNTGSPLSSGVTEANSEPDNTWAGNSTTTNDTDTFIPTASGDYQVEVMQTNPAAGTYSCAVMVLETTLFSPWFSTDSSSGYAAVTQIRNNTDSTRSVNVRYRQTSGTILCVQNLTIPANGIGLSYASNCGVGTVFGGIDISHDGRLGALSANTTTLSGQSGLSFDAPFEVRAGMTYPSHN